MSDDKKEYLPGACNIGSAEKRMRRRAGWVGLAATVVLWALFIALRIPAPWRIFLFLPAMLGAAGFLQAALSFCVNFGMRGVQNLGDVVGGVIPVETPEDRQRDRRRALRISSYSAGIAIVVAAAGFVTGLFA